MVSETASGRAQWAAKLGATAVFDPLSSDVALLSRLECGGSGPHVVFDCAGVQSSATSAFHSVRPKGTIVNLALWKGPISMDPNIFVRKQVRWIGSAVYSQGEFQEVVDAITAGKCAALST